MIHLFSRPHRSYYDHHLVRSPRRESTIWYQCNNIMFTARTQARGGLGRAFCQLESFFLRPHRRIAAATDEMVSVNHPRCTYVLCTSGSDRELDEHGRRTVYT